jgi:two-component system, LytTR family, response regulator
MNELKVVIADDDLPSKTLLSHFVQMLPEYKVVGEASDGEELIQLVMKENPDIVLVDIIMPGPNGVKAAKICKELNPSLQVIFTSGYDEYGVEAFNISAVDYIVKPIEKVRLFVALQKAKQLLQMYERAETKSVGSSKLSLKSNNTFVYIDMEDILFIEKEGRKSIVHTELEQFETMESLHEIEERLPKSFFKTHRSYLVNLKRIVQIESFGETYLAKFSNPQKKAYISKLKINEVYRIMTN